MQPEQPSPAPQQPNNDDVGSSMPPQSAQGQSQGDQFAQSTPEAHAQQTVMPGGVQGQQPAAPVPTQSGESNTFAIVGLILAIFMAPVGLILSIIARVKAKKSGNRSSVTLSTVGIVIGLALSVLLFLLNGYIVQKATLRSLGADAIAGYMQRLADGRCDEAWGYIDESSPLYPTKAVHDQDCHQETSRYFANLILDQRDNYVWSENNGIFQYKYVLSDSTGSVTIGVYTKRSNIYDIKLEQ